jgi:hypothetical protein
MSRFLLITLPTDLAPWVALGVMIVGLAIVFRRAKVKAKKDPMDESPRLSLAQQRSVERQMSNLLVELSEMARKISAQLDTRAAKLEALIKEADEKIAMLKSGGAGAGAGMGATEVVEKPKPTPPSRSRLVADIPEDEPSTGPSLIFEPPDPRYEQVYMLADQGRSAVEIARKLDRPSGEIELILALRPRI